MVNSISFYGKLPTTGDFISRNLDQKKIQKVDDWLVSGLFALIQSNENWIDDYLSAPVWSFVLSKGVWGDDLLYGAIMPSVDRVGRYFPFVAFIKPKSSVKDSLAQLSKLSALLPELLQTELTPDEIIPYLTLALSKQSLSADEFPPVEIENRLTPTVMTFDTYWWSEGVPPVGYNAFTAQQILGPQLFVRLFSSCTSITETIHPK